MYKVEWKHRKAEGFGVKEIGLNLALTPAVYILDHIT